MGFVWETVAAVDAAIAQVLPLVLAWILVSAADDLFIWTIWLSGLPARRFRALGRPVGLAERPIAIYVPCWREAEVIERMIARNLSAIRYRNYRFFVGVYPNDSETRTAVEQLEKRYENVHAVVGLRDGPTTKADNLNAVDKYRRAFEHRHGTEFAMVVLHDAEDLVHADELSLMNAYLDRFAMIQTPVLPVPTKPGALVHGTYCEDFAEYHTKDLPVRWALGGFVPSAGVGTGYRRDALGVLSAAHSDGPFTPGNLTEDYDSGVRIHAARLPQLFVPLDCTTVATREIFPDTFRGAVRQRSRWTTGIALQGWQHHGWSSPYWFWRDRKGLIGSPFSVLVNAISGFWALTEVLRWTSVVPVPSSSGAVMGTWLLLAGGFAAVPLGTRTYLALRYYGWRFACGALPRLVVGNLVNSVAALRALIDYSRARRRGRAISWAKTSHRFPRGKLGEVLVAEGLLSREQLGRALATRPPRKRIGEHLVALGMITEEQLYRGLGAQMEIPVVLDAPRGVLPAEFAHKHGLLGVEVSEGEILVAGPELPKQKVLRRLQGELGLTPRFALMPPSRFRTLTRTL